MTNPKTPTFLSRKRKDGNYDVCTNIEWITKEEFQEKKLRAEFYKRLREEKKRNENN